MKRFIDNIFDNLVEYSDPMDSIKPGIPLIKEVAVEETPDTVTTTQFSHIAQQKENLLAELDRGLSAVENHIKDHNLKLARLALEALESLQEELRALELEEAGLKDKQSEKKPEGDK